MAAGGKNTNPTALFMQILDKNLARIADHGRLRHLAPARGLDFASNDYLQMRQHPALRAAAIAALEDGIDLGAGGSRLLRGNHPAHESLESFAADYFGVPACLFMANGFAANYALCTTLPDRHDVILFDALIHASARDGIQANPARHVRIAHNDLNHYEDALRQHRDRARHIWIVVESVYSMEGDHAPLHDLYRLARQYDVTLIVDEAHATGIFGPTGKGMTEFLEPGPHLITLHTGGKALGVAGGLIGAERSVIAYLVNCARAFVYSTAPMPLQAVLLQKSLEILAAEPERRQKLLDLCRIAHHLFDRHPSTSQIIPIILGDNHRTSQIASAMQEAGYDIRAIRPPTVPEGTARLRLSLNSGLSAADILGVKTRLEGFLADGARL